jgi:hypothetical protein
VPELLPRFYALQPRREDERRIAKAILEAGEIENEAGMPLRTSADGHRRDRRRGLPVISKGVSGTAPGTDPVRELLRKEAQLERRR